MQVSSWETLAMKVGRFRLAALDFSLDAVRVVLA